MLITNQQLRQFDGIGSQNFLGYMHAHLQDHFPVNSDFMGTPALMRMIDVGSRQAALYGFTTRYEVCLFIDIMMMLGVGFDTDIQLAWIRKIIKPPMAVDPKAKIDELVETVFEYLDEVAGRGEVFPVIQYEALYEATMQPWSAEAGIPDDAEVMNDFRNVWPAKYLNVGETVLKQLAVQGQQIAAGFGLTNRVSVEFFVLLMFVFGHQFYRDPAFETISTILDNKDGLNEISLYQQLFKAVQERVAPYVDLQDI